MASEDATKMVVSMATEASGKRRGRQDTAIALCYKQVADAQAQLANVLLQILTEERSEYDKLLEGLAPEKDVKEDVQEIIDEPQV
jgi:hypothetical protein